MQYMIEAGPANSTSSDAFCQLNAGVGNQYYNITEPYDKGNYLLLLYHGLNTHVNG
jgi:hypothetical protein